MLLFKHKNVCANDFLRKKEKKMQKNQMSFLKNFTTVSAVSYTHLDVYKRQRVYVLKSGK